MPRVKNDTSKRQIGQPPRSLKSEEVLKQMGIEKDPYPADACFENSDIIGTYSADRKTVCIMIEDNHTEQEVRGFASWQLGKEVVETIANTVERLITNYGLDVHSHTMKTVKPFCNLKVTKHIAEW